MQLFFRGLQTCKVAWWWERLQGYLSRKLSLFFYGGSYEINMAAWSIQEKGPLKNLPEMQNNCFHDEKEIQITDQTCERLLPVVAHHFTVLDITYGRTGSILRVVKSAQESYPRDLSRALVFLSIIYFIPQTGVEIGSLNCLVAIGEIISIFQALFRFFLPLCTYNGVTKLISFPGNS